MIKCKSCGGFFVVNWMGVNVLGGKEKEDVDCPHCGTTAFSEMTPLFPRTRAATEAEIQLFLSKSGNPR